MIASRDVISHDEMFDVYKIQEVADRLCLEEEGKMVNGTKGNMDDLFIGGNSSTECPEGESTQSTVIPGVDIAMNHHLQETSFKKKPKSTSKCTLNQSKGNKEQRPEGVQTFMTGATEQIQHIPANFKNCQFFIGENVHPDGMVALLEYHEDGVTPYMISFRDDLEMEEC